MSAGQDPEEAGQLAGKQCAHTKKRSVLKSTVDKWIAENDKGLRLRVHVYGMSQTCPYDFFKNQYSVFLHVQVTE